MNVQELQEIFKEQIDAGLTSVTIMIEDGSFINEDGERRFRIIMKTVDLSDLRVAALGLSGLTYIRTQNDLLVFGK